MPSPSSDPGYPGTVARFGPVGFAAGALNMLVLELITWFLMPMWVFVPFIVLPIVIVNAGIAYGLTKIRAAAQIGRAMLISCIAAPLSIVLAFAAIVFFSAAGLS